MFDVALTLILFGNGLALFFMWMCGSEKNCLSRTENELHILKEENKDKN